MYGNNNNKIEIEKAENGYIVTIVIHPKERSVIDDIMPAFEKMQNKMIGDDWKNQVQEQIDELTEPLKPVRQFVCKDWKEVLKIINAENF